MESQNGFKLVSRLLIAFGVMFINLFLFSILAEFLCKAFYDISISGYLANPIPDSPKTNEINAMRMFQGIVSLGTFVISAFVISLIFKERPLEYLGLDSFPKPVYLLIVPVLLIVSMPFLSWLVEMNSKLTLPAFLSGLENTLKEMELKNERMYDLMLTMDNYNQLFLNLLVMALIPALGEELFCRGVLLNVIYDYSGKFLRSVIIVALIFTLFHMQFYKFVPMMVLALLLGLFINWTHSLWASILFHFLNNTFAVAGSFYYQRGVKNILTDDTAHMPYLLTIGSFIITIALIAWINKYSKRNSEITDQRSDNTTN